MSLKYFLLFLVNIGLSACADPKYVLANSNPPNLTTAEDGNCSIQFAQSKTCLTWSWQKIPTDTESGQIILKTFRLNQLDQTPVEVDMPSVPKVILWMPSMGHGSTPTTTEPIDTGTYLIHNVFFVMPGQWQIKFQIKNEDTLIDEAIVDLAI